MLSLMTVVRALGADTLVSRLIHLGNRNAFEANATRGGARVLVSGDAAYLRVGQAVYSSTYGIILLYGGEGYSDWKLPAMDVTMETSVLSDFWCVHDPDHFAEVLPICTVAVWNMQWLTHMLVFQVFFFCRREFVIHDFPQG